MNIIRFFIRWFKKVFRIDTKPKPTYSQLKTRKLNIPKPEGRPGVKRYRIIRRKKNRLARKMRRLNK